MRVTKYSIRFLNDIGVCGLKIWLSVGFMGNDVARDTHCNITMYNDVARDIHCDVTMSNDVVMIASQCIIMLL